MTRLIDLLEQAQKLVDEGHGEETVYIEDGHNGVSYQWSGWCTAELVDENVDGELFDEPEGTPYIRLSFG